VFRLQPVEFLDDRASREIYQPKYSDVSSDPQQSVSLSALTGWNVPQPGIHTFREKTDLEDSAGDW